jgi:hypothetical protein
MSLNNAEKAREIYDTLCSAVESFGWQFEKIEPRLLVRFEVIGEVIPMRFALLVDEERKLVRLMSRLPFSIHEDKRIEGAIMTCAATSRLSNGCFDYEIRTGAITFRMVASYRESVVGEGMFRYMIDTARATVDEYNYQFYAVNAGLFSVEEFLDME